MIPDAKNVFATWIPNEEEKYSGEIVMKTTQPLHLFGSYPEQYEPQVRGAIQVFDYSRMEGRYFEPDDRICLIFDNTDYNRLRELPEFSEKWSYGSLRHEFKYGDLP